MFSATLNTERLPGIHKQVFSSRLERTGGDEGMKPENKLCATYKIQIKEVRLKKLSVYQSKIIALAPYTTYKRCRSFTEKSYHATVMYNKQDTRRSARQRPWLG